MAKLLRVWIVALVLMVVAAFLPANDIGIDYYHVQTAWKEWSLAFDTPDGWFNPDDDRKPQYRWWWWRAGTTVVLEYETAPVDPIDKAIAVTVMGYHGGSDYRAVRIWRSMAAVMDMAGCGEKLEDLSWGLDRVIRGVVDVHQGSCQNGRRYSASLEVDRSLWVLTVENRDGCCEDFDRVRALVDESTDGEYRTLTTAFGGM